MILHILKNDLRRKKTMNIILFLFIIICTTFMASSVNNMSTTKDAIDYFAGVTKTADYNFIVANDRLIHNWIEDNDKIQQFERNDGITVTTDNLETKNKKIQIDNTTVISRLPLNFNMVLDEENQIIKKLKPGEVALSYFKANSNNLKKGDKIRITLGDKKKELTIQYICKDMVYGSQYMGFERILISSNDYNYFDKSQDSVRMSLYSLETNDSEGLEAEINEQPFSPYATFDQELAKRAYTMDMMVVSILIIVSLVLIAIALVILRFTIVFTIQEDYKEIGIMKAIGIKDRDIKGIYTIKYLFLSLTGAAIGVICSIPFGNMLLKNVQQNMAFEEAQGKFVLNVGCGLLIILLVLFFCYFSAGKINRFSAIESIRQGSTGKRFARKTPISLHNSRLPAPVYLAVNDILSSVKTYVSLLIVFILGTLLIILPINAANTLNDDKMVPYFGIAQTDFYVDNNKDVYYCDRGDLNIILDDIKQLERKYQKNGVEVEMSFESYYMFSTYKDNPKKSKRIFSSQSWHAPKDSFDYIDGEEPLRENELAMTQAAMDKLDVGIGDTVTMVMGKEKKDLIITGRFESMNNMGQSIRLSERVKVDRKHMAGLTLQGNFKDRNDIDGQREQLKKITPGYSIENVTEHCDLYLSSIRDTLAQLTLLIGGIVLFINCLVAVLMVRSLLTRNISEIALLKSIGFKDRAIRAWQQFRILIVIVIASLLGVLLSHLLNGAVNEMTFGMMGAPSIESEVDVLQVYLFYPAVLLVCTGLAAMVSTGGVGRIDMKEMNDAE